MILSYLAAALIIVMLIGLWVLYFRDRRKQRFNPHSTQARTEALRMEEETVNKLKR